MEDKQLEAKQEDNIVEDVNVEAPVEEAETEGEGEPEAQPEGKAEEPKEPAVDWKVEAEKAKAEAEAAKAEAKRQKDLYANIKGKAVHLSRVVKKGLDEGLLGESELAGDGVDAKEVQVWVERGVDKDAVDRKLQYFDSQVRGNEGWFGERYGNVNDLIQNYATILRDDPAEREALDNTPDAVVVDYILRRGKEVADEVADLRTGGSALAVIKKLKAEKAALEAQLSAGDTESIHKPKTSVKAAPAVVVKTQSHGGSFYENV